MRREFCIWLVPSAEGRVRKFRFSLPQIACVFALIAMSVTILVYVAGDYTRIQMLRAKNYLFLKQVSIERDDALSENERLLKQMESLKGANQQVLAYEADLRRRVEALGAVIESATSIGLESTAPKSARQLKKNEKAEKGIGGLEIDCSGANRAGCESDIDEISYSPSLDTLRMLHGEDESRTDLAERLEKFTGILRTIPIGFPVGGEITSGYGFRVSPFSKSVKLHKGVDFSLPQGSYIYSTADGIAEVVERNSTYGLVVEINHGNGFVTRYAHLSRAMVKEGQRIERGEVLGHVGSSGRSTGPHLHYEVLARGKAKNPGKFMELAYRLNNIL